MNKTVMLILMIMFVFIGIYSQNNMELIASLAGESANAHFGQYLTSMDFDADGVDDIITAVGYKLYVYFGSTSFDSMPDLVRNHALFSPINAGDVNGDGYDDLLVIETVLDSLVTNQCALRFFYGGPRADLVPDHEIIIPYYGGVGHSIVPLGSLGDINNDGYDDIGCRLWHSNYGPLDLAIMLGGTFQMISVVQDISNSVGHSIYGIGDANNDGYPDFMVGYAPDSSTGSDDYPRYRYVYFGGNGLNLNNNLMLLATNENLVYPGGRGIGDFNGDGYDDMLLVTYPINYSNYYTIKLGATNLSLSTEMLTYFSNGYSVLIELEHLAYGDFNGDGYGDFVSAEPNAALWRGRAGVWLGRATPNGLNDLVIQSPPVSPFHQFGWRVTTGDYNGDGFCDFAISAPTSHFGSPNYLGYVHVYAGNAELADTTVDNADETQAPALEPITLSLYPNPIQPDKVKLNYAISGKIKEKIDSAQIIFYNVKGQIVSKHNITPKQVKQGKGTLTLVKHKAGIYLSALYINNQRVTTAKITLK